MIVRGAPAIGQVAAIGLSLTGRITAKSQAHARRAILDGKPIAVAIPDGLIVPMIVGIITSGLAGWLAVAGLLKYLRTRSFLPFVIYRVVLGVVLLVIAISGWR